jgi:hypothetical protein
VIAVQVEVSHADLSEVTWMVLVEIDSVMMHATSVSATSRMLPVLADSTMTVRNVSSELSSFAERSSHPEF